MDLGLSGKTALVTASSEGLGFACAARLAEAGCSVAICGRREAQLSAARERLAQCGASNVHAISADLTDARSLEHLVAEVLRHFARLDILVINSGHSAYGSLDELAAMRANKAGDIIFLGSSSVREPPPHLLLSTVMRLGVAGFAKTLSREVARDNIRVNLISPGYFDTGRINVRISELSKEAGLSTADATARVTGDLPAGRVGSAEELAELVAFVASRKVGFLIGSNIVIDGGASRGFL